MRAIAQRSFLAVLLAASLNAQNIEGFQFDVKTLGGQSITADDFKDNVVIVDLWGTWCGPCVRAVPALERLYRKYKHFGLEIVGFNYEGDAADPEALTRKFAAKHGLTYHLAIGTPAIKQQVPNFRGYPTLLFFNRGLAHDHTEVGFSPLHEKKIERWVRKSLGLPEDGGGPAPAPMEEEEEVIEEEEEEPEEPEPLPDGVIFKPGDGDTGFDFEVEDIDDKSIKFANLRGKVVVLAMTSTWDGEAKATAKLLNSLHDQHAGDDAIVLAASLELAAQRAAKIRAIRDFQKKQDLRYPLFPAGLAFQKKIHLFTGMPLFLVFDKEGRLVLRESGSSDKTGDAITAAIEQHK